MYLNSSKQLEVGSMTTLYFDVHVYVWISMYVSYSIALASIISSCFSDNLIHDMIVLSSRYSLQY